jgi:DNA repair protein RadC
MKPRFDEKYKGIRCRVYLIRENPDSEIISISDSSAAYELVKEELVNSDRERFLSIMLTIKNHLIGVETVAVGSNHACVIRPVDVLKGAVLSNAFGCILAHNHPSGILIPSDNDIELTKHLIQAGELLGIKVLDHLIISNQGYRSLRGYCNFPI